METYHKINSIQKRYTEGPLIGQFTGEWARPEFEYLENNPWIWREKIDGTNIRVHFRNEAQRTWPLSTLLNTQFGGRTDSAQIPKPLVSKLQDIFFDSGMQGRIREAFEDSLDIGVTLYGEGYGAGIQKGGGKYGPVDFILFDVKIGDFWLLEDSVTDIANKLGIHRVPIVYTGTLKEAIEHVREGWLVSEWDNVIPEGLVVVPQIPLFDRTGHRVISKIKGVDFK